MQVMSNGDSSEGTSSDTELFIIPVSDDWLSGFDRTVRSPIVLQGPGIPDNLVGQEERIWGMYEGPGNAGTHSRMSPRDWLLFYNTEQIFAVGRVGQLFEDEELGENIWDTPESTLGFTVEDFQSVTIPLTDLRDALGYSSDYYPRGPHRVSETHLGVLRDQHDTINGFVSDYFGERPDHEERAADYERPERTETTTSRIIRNTEIVTDLKEIYDYECQVCGDRREKSEERGYAEGHHLKPLGNPHNGPDTRENIILLCPNHHADFDYGRISINPETYEVSHAYESSITGAILNVDTEHPIDTELLRYHNEEISQLPPPD